MVMNNASGTLKTNHFSVDFSIIFSVMTVLWIGWCKWWFMSQSKTYLVNRDKINYKTMHAELSCGLPALGVQ